MTAISEKDKTVLRKLAEKKAQIAALPIQKQRTQMWTCLNRLKPVKPMIYINQVPWPQTGIEEHLETTDPFCRELELELRRILYQWEHMPGDMVIEDKIYCPVLVKDTGFGIERHTKKANESGNLQPAKAIEYGPAPGRNKMMDTSVGTVISQHYEPVIKEEKDIEKIKTPHVTVNQELTKRNFQLMKNIFDGILTVQKQGAPGFWFAPWDQLVEWWGVQEALMDLALRPDMVKRAMTRLVDAGIARLEQYEKINALSLNNGNILIGSGGPGYTDELPRPDFNPEHVRTIDMWGSSTAQILSEVSPEMHQEFALEFENRWLKKFSLNYYGCCEPLHHKLHILKNIPNLRKISISPLADVEKAAAEIGDKYVISYKPNPAIFAWDHWDADAARRQLQNDLEKMKGCVVEVIMKDISTVHHQPQRLWQWAEMARGVTEQFAL